MLKPPRVPLPHVRATAYDRIAFLADHFPQLVEMYECIMEHLKIPGGEVSGGDCKWVDEKSDTFIPIYIKFSKGSTIITPEIARGMDIDGAPLYYVTEDNNHTVFAAPIPFITKDYNEPKLFMPEVMHLNYKGFILEDPANKAFIPKGTFELLQGHMATIINVYELGCNVVFNTNEQSLNYPWDEYVESIRQGSGIEPSRYDDETETPYYNTMGYHNEWDSPFGLYGTGLDLTPYTFSSIKPEDNKHIYLGE